MRTHVGVIVYQFAGLAIDAFKLVSVHKIMLSIALEEVAHFDQGEVKRMHSVERVRPHSLFLFGGFSLLFLLLKFLYRRHIFLHGVIFGVSEDPFVHELLFLVIKSLLLLHFI